MKRLNERFIEGTLESKKINKIVKKLIKDSIPTNYFKIKSIAYITIDEGDNVYESFKYGFNLGKIICKEIYESRYNGGAFYFVGAEKDIINKLKETK
jgi:hypothetical protein